MKYINITDIGGTTHIIKTDMPKHLLDTIANKCKQDFKHVCNSANFIKHLKKYKYKIEEIKISHEIIL